MVRQGLHCEPLKHKWRRCGIGLEYCWIRVRADGGWVYLCSLYLPPQQTARVADVQTLSDTIDQFLGQSETVGCLVMGDFNSPLADCDLLASLGYGGVSVSYVRRGERWKRHLLHGHVCHVLNVTHAAGARVMATHYNSGSPPTVVDYAIWFGPASCVASCTVIPTPWDHMMVCAVLRCSVVGVPSTPWVKLKRFQALEPRDHAPGGLVPQFRGALEAAFGGLEDVPCMEAWTDKVVNVARPLVGVGVHQYGRSRRAVAWWNGHLSRLQREAKQAARKLHACRVRGRGIERARADNRRARRAFRTSMVKAKNEWWRRKREGWDLSPPGVREAFKVYHLVSRKGKRGVEHARHALEEAWAGVFGSVPPADCGEAAARAWCEAHHFTELAVEDRVSLAEVKRVLALLPNHKAVGSDGLSNELLKLLPDVVLTSLVGVFNAILCHPEGGMPDAWFRNLVVLLPKVTDPSPLDYRPITLLSHVSKLLEKILWERIKRLDIPLHASQAGFVQWRGCPEQVWQLHLADQLMAQAGVCGAALFLDLKKAYDSVPIHLLVKKMAEQFPAVPGYMLRFFLQWLRGHKKLLLVDRQEARELAVERGVPQGSVLAPFLFDCFIDDLLVRLSSQLRGVSVTGLDGAVHRFSVFAFADDIAVLFDLAGGDGEACVRMCEHWGRENGMLFAPSKSKMMQLGKRSARARRPFSMHGEAIEWVDVFTYLGVDMQQRRGQRGLVKTGVYGEIKQFLQRQFTMTEAVYGTAVVVGSMMVRSVFVPKLFYGVEVFGVNVAYFRSRLGMLGKKILGAYDTDSTTAVEQFLGWEEVGKVACTRVVRFVLKVALGMGHPPHLRVLLLSVIDSDLGWAKYARKMMRQCVDFHVLPEEVRDCACFAALLRDRSGELLSGLTRGIREHMRGCHPLVRHIPERAHIGFMFFRGYFNPRIPAIAQACFLCSTREDTPGHLVECGHEGVHAILDEGCIRLEWGLTRVQRALTLAETDMTPRQWRIVGELQNRLYQLRRRARYRALASSQHTA